MLADTRPTAIAWASPGISSNEAKRANNLFDVHFKWNLAVYRWKRSTCGRCQGLAPLPIVKSSSEIRLQWRRESFASSKPRLAGRESTRCRKQTWNSEASVRLEPRHVLQIVMYHVFSCIQHVQQIQAQRVKELLGIAGNALVPCPWSKCYYDYRGTLVFLFLRCRDYYFNL